MTAAAPADGRPDRSPGNPVTAPPAETSLVRQATIAQAVLGYAITGLGACVVLLARDLHVAPARLGQLPASFGLGLLLIAAAGPHLLRRGPRLALTGGALVLAAGGLLLAVAPTLTPAVIGALLLGAGGAAFVLVTPTIFVGPHSASRLSRVVGISSVTSVLAPVAIGGLDASGLAGGRLALLLVVPPLLVLAATTRPQPAPQLPGDAGRPARTATTRRWLAMVLAVSVEFCFTVWAAARLVETGLSPERAALLGVAFPVGMAVGRLSAPLLMKRFPMMPAAAGVTASGALMVILSGHPGVVTAGIVIAGTGVAALYPITLADLAAVPGLGTAHAASLGALASGTAVLAAPALLVQLAEVVELRVAYAVTLPLLAAMLLVSLGPPARGARAGAAGDRSETGPTVG